MKKELSEEELDDLIDRDPVMALARLVEEAGLTMTFYGVPVTGEQLKEHVSASLDERIDLAICRGIKGKMTDSDKLRLLIDKIESIVPYVTATFPYENNLAKNNSVTTSNPDFVAIHGGRAASSTRQLESLLKFARELK